MIISPERNNHFHYNEVNKEETSANSNDFELLCLLGGLFSYARHVSVIEKKIIIVTTKYITTLHV